MKRISQEMLAALQQEAAAAPRRRQHRNLHDSFADPVQRLLNAIEADSYIRPHRHTLDPKMEFLVAIRGQFVLITFDEQGRPASVARFGTELHAQAENLDVAAEVPPGTWHTVVALGPGCILLECKAGPFDPGAAKELAPWAPEEGAPAAAQYLEWLRGLSSQ